MRDEEAQTWIDRVQARMAEVMKDYSRAAILNISEWRWRELIQACAKDEGNLCDLMYEQRDPDCKKAFQRLVDRQALPELFLPAPSDEDTMGGDGPTSHRITVKDFEGATLHTVVRRRYEGQEITMTRTAAGWEVDWLDLDEEPITLDDEDLLRIALRWNDEADCRRHAAESWPEVIWPPSACITSERV